MKSNCRNNFCNWYNSYFQKKNEVKLNIRLEIFKEDEICILKILYWSSI